MFSQYDLHTRQMLIGNLLLVGCCVFYLAWWIIAFKPTGAIKGMKSGWLLIGAFLCGLAGVILVVKGSNAEGLTALLPRKAVIVCGLIIYLALVAVTSTLLKRQITTELLLIVGWAVLMFLEINGLFAWEEISQTVSIVLMIITIIFAIISLVCYLLYYNLDKSKGYVDGMIPLILAAVMMIATTLTVTSFQ